MNIIKLSLYLLLLISASVPTLSKSNEESTTPEWIYSLRPGDTLWKVCKEYCEVKNCSRVLSQYNNINKDRSMPAGSKISIPIKWLKVKPIAAEVVQSNGAQRKTLTELISPLENGDDIQIMETVITQKGHATIKLADGSQLSIAPNSELMFDAVTPSEDGLIVNTNIQLFRGGIISDVKKNKNRSFNILTPSAVASVRGTIFATYYDPDSNTMKAEVDNGLIDVNSKTGSTDVPKGYAVSAEKGKAPAEPVKRLDPPVMTTDINQPISLPATLSWNKNDLATEYLVEISTDKTIGNVLNQYAVASNQVVISNSLDDGQYFVTLRAIDANDFTGMPGNYAVNLINSPDHHPINLSWRSDHKKISWNQQESVNGINYYLETSECKSFRMLLDIQPLNTETAKLHAKKENIYTRIRANNGNSDSYSNIVFIKAKKSMDVLNRLRSTKPGR